VVLQVQILSRDTYEETLDIFFILTVRDFKQHLELLGVVRFTVADTCVYMFVLTLCK
jgi:hypothetical protein